MAINSVLGVSSHFDWSDPATVLNIAKNLKENQVSGLSLSVRERTIPAYSQVPGWQIWDSYKDLTPQYVWDWENLPEAFQLQQAGWLMALYIYLLPCTSVLMLQRMDGAHEYWDRLKDVTTCTDKIMPVSGHQRVGFLPWRVLSGSSAGWSIKKCKPGASGENQAGKAVPSLSGWSLSHSTLRKEERKGSITRFS